MADSTIAELLTTFRQHVMSVRNSFPELTLKKVSGPGSQTVTLTGSGGFRKLGLERNSETVLTGELNIPAQVNGIELAGQRLEGTLFALYPVQISAGGKNVFEDEMPTVAAGPALFTVLPELKEGSNGPITLRIRVPNQQPTQWVNLRLTTPSIRHRFKHLDIAWARLYLADAVAQTPAERDAVDRAAQLVPRIMQTTAGDELEPLLNALGEALSPLAERIAGITVHLIGHSHIDMNWLWTWPDTVQVILRDFRSVVDLMRDYPELTFSHSQPATYEVVRREDPELFRQVLKLIRLGRWETTTMQWVEADSNMPSGEAHVRQLLHGVLYSREVLGTRPTTFHAPDAFGHAGNLPQLAGSAGALRYYHHRANPGQADQWPAYWWEGIDGSRILGISTRSYNGEITAGDLALAAARAHRFGHRAALMFHGIGDHGGGPVRQNLEVLRRLQKTPGLPTARCSTLEAYTTQLLADGGPLPLHRGESRTIFEGCYTTHADGKRYNRCGENLLCTVDALNALSGIRTDDAITDAWRRVLFNQFHDILDGSAIHESYDDHRRDFEIVESAAAQAIDRALDVLEADVPDGSIAVTNPLGHDRVDFVHVKYPNAASGMILESTTGHRTVTQACGDGVGFIAQVPAYATVGYRVVELERDVPILRPVPATAPTRMHDDGTSADSPGSLPYYRIDTDFYTLLIRRDNGIIVSLIDHRTGQELVPHGLCRASDYTNHARPDLALGVLQLIDEGPHGMSAWQLMEVRNEQNLISGADVQVVETGPVRCVLEVKHQVRRSTINERIIVYRALPRIDFALDIDWQEVGSDEAGVPGLKFAFTARLLDCQAWYETPFGAVRRPADGTEVPALRWADVGGDDGGVAVLNDSKYGYDALGNRLRLTLLRSAYDPDTISDVGRHHIRVGLLPHVSSWRQAGVVQAGLDFNQPLLGRVARARGVRTAPTFRPYIVDAESAGACTVQLAALKPAERGEGVVIRLYESGGRSAQVALGGLPENHAVYETNVVEDPQTRCDVRDGTLRLNFRPWQVRTLLVKPL